MTISGLAKLKATQEPKRLTQSYRRNGKLQSCEPCRKGKLRCDHTLPHCSRCIRRNREEQCIYHPAPLTKSKVRSPRSDDTSPPIERQAEPSPEKSNTWTAKTTDLYASHGCTRLGPDALPSPEHANPGFLGLTSFSSIWDENRVRLGLDTQTNETASVDVISEERIRRGIEVLSFFREPDIISKCLDRWFGGGGGGMAIEPMMKQWMSDLQSSWGRVIKAWDPEQMRALSIKIWRNTQSPLLFDGRTSARDWTSLFSGPNLRWEAVGNIYSIAGLMCTELLPSDPFFENIEEGPFDSRQYSRNICTAAEFCTTFCKDARVVNDVYVWLLFENCLLMSRFIDRDSYTSWQMFGELMSSLIVLGLHQEIRTDDRTPFFLAEIRKRSFIHCYSHDKQLATFLGRPPRLSKRYCLLQLPSDLSDTQLMADETDVQTALSELDTSGWNTRNQMNRNTVARVYSQNAQIREDILELSLGVMPITRDELVTRAAEIQAQADALDAALPAFLRRDFTSGVDPQCNPQEVLMFVYLRIQYFMHAFLLQRTLVRKATINSHQLGQVAHKIVSLCLVIINHRDMMRDFQLDIAIIVHALGIPAAATIAVHLLHLDQHLESARPYTLQRSQIIQELCVFTSYLATAPKNDGMSSVAEQGRKFLNRVLDQILSPRTVQQRQTFTEANKVDNAIMADFPGAAPTASIPSEPLPPSSLLGPNEDMYNFTNSLFEAGTDADFVKWLDSVDWENEAIAGWGSGF